MLRHYRCYGLTIASDIAFPEELLAVVGHGHAAWQVRRHAELMAPRQSLEWFHRWQFPDGREWVAFGRDALGYLLRFPGIADFDVRPDQRTIDCFALTDVPEDTLQHLTLDQVMPLVLGTPASMALHGSSVATPAGAVIFLGESGLGKSTLAARLGRRGLAVLADDCALLRVGPAGFEVVPAYPGVRLHPDSVRTISGAEMTSGPVAHYSTKRRIAAGFASPFPKQAVPLARVYVISSREQLQRVDAITIEPMSKRDALYALTDFTFHLDINHIPRVRETFGLAGDLVDACELHVLEYPWDLGGTDAIVDAVLEHAGVAVQMVSRAWSVPQPGP